MELITLGKVAKVRSTRPANSSVVIGAAPRNGMCCRSTPALVLNNSAARWEAGPTPVEA